MQPPSRLERGSVEGFPNGNTVHTNLALVLIHTAREREVFINGAFILHPTNAAFEVLRVKMLKSSHVCAWDCVVCVCVCVCACVRARVGSDLEVL